MIELFVITLLILVFVQIFTFVKVMRLVSQISKMLLEVRLLFKNSGIYYLPNENRIVKATTCRYCRFRQTFIHLTEQVEQDNFYYLCKKHEKEVALSDRCEQFERDFQST